MARSDLTAARLRELVSYDPDTGIFRRRLPDGSEKPGPYGCLEPRGYVIMAFGGIGTFRGHRLAWLYVHGEWPRCVIDHINGIKSDNRIVNLRDVPISMNAQNIRNTARDSASGVLGVYPWRGKWRSILNGKHLGMFQTKEEANQMYLLTKRATHPGCTI